MREKICCRDRGRTSSDLKNFSQTNLAKAWLKGYWATNPGATSIWIIALSKAWACQMGVDKVLLIFFPSLWKSHWVVSSPTANYRSWPLGLAEVMRLFLVGFIGMKECCYKQVIRRRILVDAYVNRSSLRPEALIFEFAWLHSTALTPERWQLNLEFNGQAHHMHLFVISVLPVASWFTYSSPEYL